MVVDFALKWWAFAALIATLLYARYRRGGEVGEGQEAVAGKGVEDSSAPPPPSCIVFTVNGAVHRVESPSPSLTLLGYLRDRCGLTGAKIGCGEGGCGACTVMISSYDDGAVRHAAVNAWCAPEPGPTFFCPQPPVRLVPLLI